MNMLLACLSFLFVTLMTSPALSADYYVDASSGNDSNSGSSPAAAWRTLAKVNSFSFEPGDNIYLERGEVWEEELIVPTSGTKDNVITFSAYGHGNNPLIKCTNSYNGWSIADDSSSARVWKGAIPGLKNTWGAMKDGVRITKYHGYKVEGSSWSAPENLKDMKEDTFYSPLNSSTFFIRNDSGHPGVVEIGTRVYGILLKEKQYVIIDSIDVTGPSGRPDNGGHDYIRPIHIETCDHIIVRNCSASYHNLGGFAVANGSTNCRVEKCTSHGHGSTGVYFWEAGTGNRITHSKVYDCGTLASDFGDMGLIGIWRTEGVAITDCIVNRNGHTGIGAIDSAISFVQSPNGHVSRCEISNTGGNSVQFAENSDNGSAHYNVIQDWGTSGLPGMNHGVRVGGGKGTSTALNCKIYNNVLSNTKYTSQDSAALRVMHYDNKGLIVKNNIFYQNDSLYDLFLQSKDGFKEWDFSNNVYYRVSGMAAVWAEKKYGYDEILGDKPGFFSFDTKLERDSIEADPLIDLSSKSLDPTSPCIDKGVVIAPATDYNGTIVPIGTTSDIGPFEYNGTETPLVSSIQNENTSTSENKTNSEKVTYPETASNSESTANSVSEDEANSDPENRKGRAQSSGNRRQLNRMYQLEQNRSLGSVGRMPTSN